MDRNRKLVLLIENDHESIDSIQNIVAEHAVNDSMIVSYDLNSASKILDQVTRGESISVIINLDEPVLDTGAFSRILNKLKILYVNPIIGHCNVQDSEQFEDETLILAEKIKEFSHSYWLFSTTNHLGVQYENIAS